MIGENKMDRSKLKIAVVGATGNVGRMMLNILAERGFSASQVRAIASANSVGKKVSFGDDDILSVEGLIDFNFSTVDVALFSPGGKVSAEYAPKAAAVGCVVIDNTSYFRDDPKIPLIIPEINAEDISDYKNKNIIANPNCAIAPIALALKPLHDEIAIKGLLYQRINQYRAQVKLQCKNLINKPDHYLQAPQPPLKTYPDPLHITSYRT